MTTVYVTNRGEKPLIHEFAFSSYTFPVDEPIEISVDMARHVFGYQQEDKLPAMVRLGLCRSTNEIDEGRERLAKFEITLEKPEKNRFLSPGDDLVTPLVPKAHRGRTVVKAA